LRAWVEQPTIKNAKTQKKKKKNKTKQKEPALKHA
jgi:hypothetical protein